MGFAKGFKALCSERFYFFYYAGFLAGYFLFPEAPEHYRYYYILVVLPLIAGCVKGLAPAGTNPLYGLIAAYIIYMVLTSFWSDPFSWTGFAGVAWYGALVAVFVLATAAVRNSDPVGFDKMLQLLVVLAAITALVSIYAWYSKHPFPRFRLQLVSRMHHEILAGCAYGFFALLALHYVHMARSGVRRAGFFILLLVLIATVLLTQSRTALVALIIASIALGSFRERLAIVALAVVVAVALAFQPELWQGLIRSMPYRPGIWSAVLAQAQQHWLLGAGYLSETAVEALNRSFVHAHSAYLATLRDGGVIGLGLLLGVLGTAATWAYRLDRRNGRVFYLALVLYGLVCAIPDLDRLLTRPKEPWLFLWLPIALVMADYYRQARHPGAGRDPEYGGSECMDTGFRRYDG